MDYTIDRGHVDQRELANRLASAMAERELTIEWPKVIQYPSPNGRLIYQSVLGARFEDPKFGGSFHHYPLSGGVGVIREGAFKVVREATDGDIAMVLRNCAMAYDDREPFKRPPSMKRKK